MANSWLRLWHDMPNDPKWRTIAKASKHPVTSVVAVYLHMLVCASIASVRGCLESFSTEDVASALDLDSEAVDSIVAAMEGRVISNGKLLGWDKRQPVREDNSAERTKAWREKQKQAERSVTQSERTETILNAGEQQDKDTDKDAEEVSLSIDKDCAQQKADRQLDCPHQEIIALYAKHLPELPQPRIWNGQRAKCLQARWRWVLTATKQDGQRYATTTSEAINFFDRFFAYVARFDFLTGRDGKWQGCDLGWLIKAENFAKVIEGKYERREVA